MTSQHLVTRVDLLRHGACEGGEIFRGSTDVALSEAGWQQMQQRVQTVSGWQRIVCSNLQRCQRFAEHLGREQVLPVLVEPAFRELHFGDWEGRLLSEVQQQDAQNWQQFWDDIGSARPPGGESMQDLAERVLPALERVIEAHRGEHLLIVAHGAVNRVLACHLLKMPLSAAARLSHPYAGFMRFEIHHGESGQADWPLLVGFEG